MTHFTPAREQDAYFVIRGFVYQVNTTILRWINLSPDEVLELERGEDIDHLSKWLGEGVVSSPSPGGEAGGADAGESQEARRERLLEQIKSLEDSVTLTSARSTLANFAAHRRANRRWRLRFRYTTNAKVGVENPYVLPSFKKAAIEVWRDLASDRLEEQQKAQALREVRQALSTYACPPELESALGRASWTKFQEDIRESSDDKLLEFIGDFEWGTGEEQPADLSIRICRELQETGIVGTEADAADAHRRLFLHVFQLLGRPGLKRLSADDIAAHLVAPPDQEERRLLRHIVDFVVSWQDALRQRLDDLELSLSARVEDAAAGVKEHVDLRFAQENAARAIEQRLDDVRPLLGEGKWRSALAQLGRVRQAARDAQHGMGDERSRLMARVAGHEGICHWHMDDMEAARHSFAEELRWLPDSAHAKGHLALALQESDPARALQLAEDARRDAELWPSATAILLRAGYEKDGWQAVAARLKAEPDAKNHAIVMVALGAVALQGRRYGAAQRHARRAIEMEMDDHSLPSAYRLLADALVAPLYEAQRVHHQNTSDSKFLAHSISIWDSGWSPLAQEHWRQTEAALTRLIELTTGWQTPVRRQAAFAQRAEARHRLGLDEQALQDCERVLTDPERDETRLEYAQTFFVKGLGLAQIERLSHAVEAFDDTISRSQDDLVRSQANLFAAQLLGRMGEWPQVIERLADRWQPDPQKRDIIDVAATLLLAYHRLDQRENLNAVRRALQNTYGEDPVAWAILSEQARRDAKPRLVIRYLETALKLAKDPRWPRSLGQQIAYNLAVEHGARGHYRRCGILLRPLIDTARPNEALYNYLLCLDRTGRYHQALELARQARRDGPAIVPHSSIEAAIAEEVGDLQLASRLRRELSQADRENITHALRLAYVEQELGNLEAARTAIDAIPFETVFNDPQKLMRMAQARADFGLPNSLEWAYRARKLALNDADIHFSYVQLLHMSTPVSPHDPPPSVTRVEPECAVHLSRRDQVEILIVTGHPIEELRDLQQVPLDDPRASLLLGRAVGDKVILHPSRSSSLQVPHEIVKIDSKFIHALNETVGFFEGGMLHHERIEANHHDPSNEQELLEQMRELTGRGAQSARITDEFYRQYAAPVSTIAMLRNRSLVEVWDKGFGMQFYVEQGTSNEIDQALQISSSLDQEPSGSHEFDRETPVVLDMTSLLFLQHVELAGYIAELFPGRLLVPQAVREEFSHVLRRNELEPTPMGYLSGDGSEVQLHDTPAEFHQARREFWRQILRFIDENTEVVPVYALAAANPAEGRIYTRSTLAAVLLAKERKCVLMSDDLRVRFYAQSRHKVQGVWTNALLIHLGLHGKIDLSDYFEALRKLILAGQGYLPMRGDFLLWLYNRNQGEVTNEVRWFLQQFHLWRLTNTAATSAAADFLWQARSRPFDASHRHELQEAVLQELVRDRHVPSVLNELRQQLRLHLLPELLANRPLSATAFLLHCLKEEINALEPRIARRESSRLLPESMENN